MKTRAASSFVPNISQMPNDVHAVHAMDQMFVSLQNSDADA